MKRRILLITFSLITSGLAFHINFFSIITPEALNTYEQISYSAALTGADFELCINKSEKYAGLAAFPSLKSLLLFTLADGAQCKGVYLICTGTKVKELLPNYIAAGAFREGDEKGTVLPEETYKVRWQTKDSYQFRPASRTANTS